MLALRFLTHGLVLGLVLFPPGVEAGSDLDEFDRKIGDELRSRNPIAADLFSKANLARQAGKHQEAADLYHQTVAAAPDFDHAIRREGYERLLLDQRLVAVSLMRTAMEKSRSPENMQGLATALASETKTSTPSKAEIFEASTLVREVETLGIEDPNLAFLGSQLALEAGDSTWFAVEARRLVRLIPENPAAHYILAVHLAATGDRAGARAQLEEARSLGLPDKAYRGLKGQIEARSPYEKIMFVGLLILGIWLAGLLLLIGIGAFLSRGALAASRAIPRARTGEAIGFDAALRRAYRYVLTLCCAYYFISIPVVIGVVLLTGGGLVYLMVMAGHIPLKLLAFVVVITVVTLWAVLKSLIVRVRDEDPGLKLLVEDHPRLREVLDEVAGKIETRPVTNVYLTPGTDFAVMERGGVFRQLRGHSERCLILGIGVLEGMAMRPFRAVLAHEYGHFSNRDTAGGGFALTVRLSIQSTAVNLARGGAATWYNPAWLFVNGFYRVFLRISQGASRLQEVLADRWAAFAYGSRSFAEGLRHVVERSIRFNVHANSVLKEVMEGEKPLANLYSYRPQHSLAAEPDLALALDEALSRKPTPYDSHPSPVDRIAWVDALNVEGGAAQPDDRSDAWSLFSDRQELERCLTDEIRKNVAVAHGWAPPRESESSTGEIVQETK
jgi:Zn-dependent protease with chaperone function